jgi:tRNA(Ile)-lysidine synthase
LETEILHFIDQYELIEAGDKLLLGLSGGPDSVFAFNFLLKYKKRLKTELICIHVNHMLRGQESDNDEKFVRDLCNRRGIELHVCNFDTKKYSSENDYSIEEAARKIRYNEYYSMRLKTGCSKIVTAHICNDNTETVFLNTIKGTGLSGFSGIPVKRDNIIRPFLAATKNGILEYLDTQNIEYRKDSSNYSADFQRNYLRINIIPELENNLNPSLHNSILNTSLNLQAALSYLNMLVDNIWKESVVEGEDSVDLLLEDSELNNEYIFGEVIKKICSDYLKIEFNRKLFDQLSFLMNVQTGRNLDLENGWQAVRERKSIRFFRENRIAGDSQAALKPGEDVVLNGVRVGCEFLEGNFEMPGRDNNAEIISADKLDDIFILRRWKSGDKFQPLGMKGNKKLSDFLTEQKVPSSDKNKILVLTNNETIVWVVGLRINEKFKYTKKTKKVLKLWTK